MKNTLIKYLAIIAFIIVVCVALAHTLSSSETVADYAAREKTAVTPVAVEIEKISEDEAVTPASTGSLSTPAETDSLPTKGATDVDPAPDATVALPTSGANTEVEKTEKSALTEEVKNEAAAEESSLNADEGFYIETISDELKEKMRGRSYAADIDESKVNFDTLRHVVIRYNDFNGGVSDGELVCNELIAQDLLEIFKKLYENGYMLEEVALIDKYDADDDASMEANNTSCFNYRLVDRSTKLSYHAYGLAIDVNPFYNPYVEYGKGEGGSDYICPTQSVPYAYRDKDFPYKIDENDLCYKLFKEHGFIWGGDWNSCKDYQHFEKRLIKR